MYPQYNNNKINNFFKKNLILKLGFTKGKTSTRLPFSPGKSWIVANTGVCTRSPTSSLAEYFHYLLNRTGELFLTKQYICAPSLVMSFHLIGVFYLGFNIDFRNLPGDFWDI
jgi:hypothetical protein